MQKHDRFPGTKEADHILFSMFRMKLVGKSERKPMQEVIQDCIDNFPRNNGALARSATMAISGTNGNNVPVDQFQKLHMGVVFDPTKVAVHFGDFVGVATMGKVPKPEDMASQTKITSGSVRQKLTGEGSLYKLRSKFPLKKIFRRKLTMGGDMKVTDHSRWDGMSKRMHKNGSADVFARNLWRRYFKPPKVKHEGRIRKFFGKPLAKAANSLVPVEIMSKFNEIKKKGYDGEGIMFLNELLLFQMEDQVKTPVTGLIIDVTGHRTTDADTQELIATLQRNPEFKLHFYDKSQKDHIVRLCDNVRAQEILNKGAEYVNGKSYFEDLTNYTDREDSPIQRPITLKEKAIELIDEVEQREVEMIFSIDRRPQDIKRDLVLLWKGTAFMNTGNLSALNETKEKFTKFAQEEMNQSSILERIEDISSNPFFYEEEFDNIVKELLMENLEQQIPGFTRKYNIALAQTIFNNQDDSNSHKITKDKMSKFINDDDTPLSSVDPHGTTSMLVSSAAFDNPR
jgi:hypothetical protein